MSAEKCERVKCVLLGAKLKRAKNYFLCEGEPEQAILKRRNKRSRKILFNPSQSLPRSLHFYDSQCIVGLVVYNNVWRKMRASEMRFTGCEIKARQKLFSM